MLIYLSKGYKKYIIAMNLDKGIIPMVMGGLGNQMFTISAAYAAHLHTGLPMYLLKNTIDNNKHNHKGRDYNETIFREFEPKLPYTKQDQELHQLLGSKGYRVFCGNLSAFAPWYLDSVFPGAIFSNYFQYYPPLAAYESELRTKYCKGLEPFRTQVSEKYESLDHAAFLHIRRGDYLNLPHFHYNQTLDYYEKAVQRLLAENPKIQKVFVVSDDIEWAKQQPYFQQDVFTFFDSDDELLTMAFMSLCTGGAICANSTFSWWGAFLGAYESRNPVIVPSRWISDQVYSLFPQEWIII